MKLIKYLTGRISNSTNNLDKIYQSQILSNNPVLQENYKIRRQSFVRHLLSLFFLYNVVFVLMSSVVHAEHYNNRKFFIHGVAATGINDLCGLPLFSLPVPAGASPTTHATVMGEYNPDSDLPITISPTNCDDDIILATNTDPNFLARTGLPDIDIRLKNIPLRDVPVIRNPDGSRGMIPPLNSVPGNAFPVTKSNPNDTITLGDWLSARGWMYINCKADGSAKILMRFKNLIPNGVYSLWGIWNTTPPGTERARIIPLPLGGIPNAMVPDSKGRATFMRELASCPKDATEDGSIMMFVDLAFHSDSSLTGAFPQISGSPTKFKTSDGDEFSSTLVPGAVTHDHLLFLISGEKL